MASGLVRFRNEPSESLSKSPTSSGSTGTRVRGPRTTNRAIITEWILGPCSGEDVSSSTDILDEVEKIPKAKTKNKIAKPLQADAPPPYFQNAPLKRLKHPLEENIFTSLIITLVAVSVALLLGIPVLLFVGSLLVLVLVIRYLTVILEGCCRYIPYICSNRNVPSSRLQPRIFPLRRLAFANDVRWLGKKRTKEAQAILHTVLIFEGCLELSNLRHLVQTRVLQAETSDGELSYPRLLQRVVPLLGGYQWETDSQFDIQNHIFYGPLHLRSEAPIQEYLGFLLMESLPQGKPLWEIRVIPNYGTQRDTLAILRVHQSLADGMTLVRILSHSLADQAQLHIPQHPHFAGLTFSFNVIRSLIVGPLTLFLWLCMTTRDKSFFSRPLQKRQFSQGSSRLSKQETDGASKTQLLRCNDRSRRNYENTSRNISINKPPTGIGTCIGTDSTNTNPNFESKEQSQEKQFTKTTSPISLGRDDSTNSSGSSSAGSLWNVMWSASLSVTKVARLKQIMRSSLNDVLLSAMAGSIRTYLQSQGISYPGDVKVVIPVDLRNDVVSPKYSTKLGCKVASILTAVPSGTEAAIPRLWATRHRLDEVKASADPVVAYGAASILMNLFPQKIGASILDSITDKASLIFCNLSGPTSTVVVGGFPLKGVYPIYPPSGRLRLSITIFTYADQIHITVLAHRSLHNACQNLMSGMYDQVDQLSRHLSHRRVPGESRRSARNSTTNTEITKPPTRQIHFQLQVVQEQLQKLSHQLDHPERFVDPNSEDATVGLSLGLGPIAQTELRTKLRSLKTEFTELIGELRRRTSIVEGVTISFEDEEMEEEFRKPRKRALSVVSMSVSRRNSLFSAQRTLTTPESSHCYSSDDDDMSSVTPPPQTHIYSPSLRQSSSPIRTTAV